MTALRLEGGGGRSAGPIERVSKLTPGPGSTRCNKPIPQTRCEIPRVLTTRVDAFYLAFQGLRSEVTLRELTARAAHANALTTGVTCAFGDHVFVLHESSREGWWRFENEHFAGTYQDSKRTKGWRLELIPNAPSLAEQGSSALLAEARDIARQFLEVVQGERVRRLDLCADVIGLNLNEIDQAQWVTQRRTRNVCARSTLAENFHIPERTSWTIGKDGIVLCAYDKIEELAVSPSPKAKDKRAAEERRWRAAGWNGTDAVTRVEFRATGAPLKELEDGRFRDPDGALDLLDDAWAYFTRKWVRLAVVDSAPRRTRWRTDPRWSVVQDAVFVRNEGVIGTRTRRRSPARARIAFNTASNFAAFVGALEPKSLGDLSNEDATRFVREHAQVVMNRVAEHVVDEFLEAYGPKGAAEHFVEKWNAALTRAGQIKRTDQGLELRSKPDEHEFTTDIGEENEIRS